MNLNKICQKTSKFILKEGNLILKKQKNLSLKFHKDGIDLSTNFDTDLEKKFSDFVKINFKDHGFFGEEIPALNRHGEYTWYFDPIDGTKYFAKEIPLWSISAALVETKTQKPILGIIYNPVSKQIYTAIKNKGAFLNNKRLGISKNKNSSELQIAIDLSLDLKNKSNLWLSGLIKKFYKVRMIGNGSLALAWLAQDMFGAYLDPRRISKEVDIAAGLLIAEEAGASIFIKNLDKKRRQIIVGQSEKIVEEIKKIISSV